jgi:hypothetical protein
MTITTTASRSSRPLTHPPDAWIRARHRTAHASDLAGFTRRVATPEGTVTITLNAHAAGPREVFFNVRRAADVAARAEVLGRRTSLYLRLPSTMSHDERLRQAATPRRGSGGSRSVGDGAAGVDHDPTRSTTMSPSMRPCHDAAPVYTTAAAHPPTPCSGGALPLD